MTKRTNAFQKAIFYIHDQLKDTDATVTESTELREQKVESPIDREVDVLIEKKIANNTYRIAIECRDRSKIDDIQWIDSIIGKYINLQVDRKIAVSKAGFSKNAIVKARSASIELRTLKEITKFDWKSEYENLGFADFNINFKINEFQLQIVNNPQLNISIHNIILLKDRRIKLKTLINLIQEGGLLDHVNKEFKKNMSTLYETRADLEKTVQLTKELPLKETEIIIKNKPYKLVSIKVIVIGTPTVRDTDLKSFSYQDSIISTGTVEGNGKNEHIRFYLSQAQPENKVQISFEKIKKQGK